MNIEIFDSYNIRARVCPCIILLSPIALTLFLCFSDQFDINSSAVIIVLLLAFANCIPTIQRIMFKNSKLTQVNYAAQYLSIKDNTINSISKKRYYQKLTEYNPQFETLYSSDSLVYMQTCESAVSFIRNINRDNKQLLEENINYGFSKNMLLNKPYGIIICIINIIIIVFYSLFSNTSINAIPKENWIAVILNVLILSFWLFIISSKLMQESGKQYAIALIESIDNISLNQ